MADYEGAFFFLSNNHNFFNVIGIGRKLLFGLLPV